MKTDETQWVGHDCFQKRVFQLVLNIRLICFFFLFSLFFVFSVSVKPSSLSNCTIKASLNQTTEILEVECVAGYDGGLRQEFRLEAYEAESAKLKMNISSVSSDVSLFRINVPELLPSTHFYFIVYAVNAKGRSDPVRMENIMIRDTEKHAGKFSDFAQTRFNPLFENPLEKDVFFF